MSEISDKIDEKIKEKTGLKTKTAIQAYFFFYKAADMNDGVIMYGNVKSDFYDEERKKILKEKNLPSFEVFDKKDKEKVEELLEKKGDNKYYFWLRLFQRKGLVSNFQKVRESDSSYPLLLGYNPFNDFEFYIPYRSRGEKRWNGRVSREHYEQIKNDPRWAKDIFKKTPIKQKID